MSIVLWLVVWQVATLEKQGDAKEAEIRQLQATNDYLRACPTGLGLLASPVSEVDLQAELRSSCQNSLTVPRPHLPDVVAYGHLAFGRLMAQASTS